MRPIEPSWTRWDDLSWEQKMRISRNRLLLGLGFALLVAAAMCGPFVLSVARP
ncbi:MAG TPA: hypothetical protein VNM16_10155 [Bacillota bacterium]|nr:hypothetical protein [Bacillota bacterium]